VKWVDRDRAAAGTMPGEMAGVVLWHIAFSNFNEKARWALDYKRVPHVRRSLESGLHPGVALVLTRGKHKTFPLLQIDGQTVGDSTAIIAGLERRFPEPSLYPSDPDERRRALDLEDYFDESFGHEVRRLAFWRLLSDDESGLLTLREMAGPLPAPALRAMLPGFRATLFSYYRIDDGTAARARELIETGFDLIEAERGGGEYLVGDRFSVADLAAASLIGPVLLPPEFSWQPRGELPPTLESLRQELSQHPAWDWALRTYARHRLPVARPVAAAAA
jgi:glutathione S-transferase